MKISSLSLRHMLAVLFIGLALGALDAAPVSAASNDTTVVVRASVPIAGIADYVLNDRTRVVQVSTIALFVGILILVKQ